MREAIKTKPTSGTPWMTAMALDLVAAFNMLFHEEVLCPEEVTSQSYNHAAASMVRTDSAGINRRYTRAPDISPGYYKTTMAGIAHLIIVKARVYLRRIIY